MCGRLLRELTRLVRRRMLMSGKLQHRDRGSDNLSIRVEPIGSDHPTAIVLGY